jgi:hypothetical protein
VSSFEPSERANQLQTCREIARGFLVACGHAAEVFDELEETFDQIALPVKREIAIAFVLAIRLWRNDRLDRARPEAGNVGVGVVALVGQDGFRLDLCGQRFSVMSWAWPAVRVNASWFPSASTIIWIFVVRPPRERPMAWLTPFFLRAPALC